MELDHASLLIQKTMLVLSQPEKALTLLGFEPGFNFE